MASLVELCQGVIEGARQALRLQAEGVSTRSGPVPDWVREATDFKVDGVHAGSTILTLDAPVLSETPLFSGDGAAPDGFRPDETALSVFGQVVADLETGALDSDRVDHSLLATFARFSKLGTGVRVEFSARGTLRKADTFTVDQEIIRTAARLQAATPSDHAVVLTGRLDAIEHGSSRFTLITDDGRRVKGTFTGSEAHQRLRDLWGRRITLQGMARYTAAGRVRFVEASVVRAYAEGDDTFAALTHSPMLPIEGEPPVRKGSGLASLRGAWPGDESIDALLASLKGSE